MLSFKFNTTMIFDENLQNEKKRKEKRKEKNRF